VVAGGAALVFAPLFSMLTAAVMFLANVRIEVVRDIEDSEDDADEDDAPPPNTGRIRIDVE
jgi:4-hydroxybenzoate polyprenyltransferase